MPKDFGTNFEHVWPMVSVLRVVEKALSMDEPLSMSKEHIN